MKSATIEEQVLGLVCSVFDAYSAVLFLPDESGEKCYLAASFSLGNRIAANAEAAPGKGLVGWIIENRRHMLNIDMELPLGQLGYYDGNSDEKIKAFMGFPVPTGGAICVDSKKRYAFSEKDCKLLQLFAELIASQQSEEHRKVGGELPRYFAQLDVIRDLRFHYKRWPVFLENMLRAVSEGTGFDYCAFATLREGGESFCIECESVPLALAEGKITELPLGSGIAGWVFRTDQAVFLERGSGMSPSALFGRLPGMPDFSTVICLPVIVNKTCRGVLCLAHASAMPIDENLRIFVNEVADHLSMFLENLYLKSRLRGLMARVVPPVQAPDYNLGANRTRPVRGDDNPA